MWESTIPSVYNEWSFATFPVGAAGNAATAGLAQAKEAARIGTGLWVFAGAHGTGKTGLAVCILRTQPASALLWVDGFTLMSRLTEVAAGKRSKELLAELSRAEMLCIDDLGYAISKETASRSAATRELQELLMRREDKLTLVTLSGHSSDQATYVEFCAWLRRAGRVIDLGTVDMREQLFDNWERPAQLSHPVQSMEGSARLRQSSERLLPPSRSQATGVASRVLARETPAQPTPRPARETSGSANLCDIPGDTPVVQPSFTICFIFQGNRVLLLNRLRSPFMGLWNGVGGKIETGETPQQCVLREVREETGIDLQAVEAAGIVSWGGDIAPGGMYVYTARLSDNSQFQALRSGREGILAWHDLAWVYDTANQGVVDNIRHFLPAIEAGQHDLEHCLTYKNGQLIGYESRRIPCSS